MKYDEVEHLSGEPWEIECKNLCIDSSKEKEEGRYCICKENKDTYIECLD